MNNIAIIPARSGSKGLKDKNIKLLNGKPLIGYTIEAALQSGLFDEVFVSTDSAKYAEIAINLGATVPFLRSEAQSSDTASSWGVVKETLKEYEQRGHKFGCFCLLQPTSPLRTSEDIIAGYNLMNEKNANAIVGVCEVEHSPLLSNVLPGDLSLENFVDFTNAVYRQKLPKYFRLNGAMYIVKTDYFAEDQNIYRNKCYACIMEKTHSIDIDDEIDMLFAETVMKHEKT